MHHVGLLVDGDFYRSDLFVLEARVQSAQNGGQDVAFAAVRYQHYRVVMCEIGIVLVKGVPDAFGISPLLGLDSKHLTHTPNLLRSERGVNRTVVGAKLAGQGTYLDGAVGTDERTVVRSDLHKADVIRKSAVVSRPRFKNGLPIFFRLYRRKDPAVSIVDE